MFTKSCLVVTLAIFALQGSGAFAANNATNSTGQGGHNPNRDRLITDLVNDYNRYVIPSDVTTVRLGLSYICPRLDTETNVLKSRVWLLMKWNDPRLRWDPARYGGIKEGRLPAYRLWNPDIMLWNSLETEDRSWTNVLISNDGNVTLVTPTSWTTACSPDDDDSTAFDCRFKLGSWSYDGTMLPLELVGDNIDMTNMEECGGKLEVTDVNAKINKVTYQGLESEYHSLDAQLKLKRRQ